MKATFEKGDFVKIKPEEVLEWRRYNHLKSFIFKVVDFADDGITITVEVQSHKACSVTAANDSYYAAPISYEGNELIGTTFRFHADMLEYAPLPKKLSAGKLSAVKKPKLDKQILKLALDVQERIGVDKLKEILGSI